MTEKNVRRKKTNAEIKADNKSRETAKAVEVRKSQPTWGQVHEQYVRCHDAKQAIGGASNLIGILTRLPKGRLDPKDEQELIVLAKALKQDHDTYTAELVAIHDSHKDKTDKLHMMEIMEAYVIFERYNAWFERFNAGVINGTLSQIHSIAMKYTEATQEPTP